MVNIFGFKLFEGPSSNMEEQMRNKHGTHNRRHSRKYRHSPDCECPICHNKEHKNKKYRNRKYRGGYTYKQSKEVSEEDVTKSLNSLSKTEAQSQTQSRQHTKFRTHGKMKTKKHQKHN